MSKFTEVEARQRRDKWIGSSDVVDDHLAEINQDRDWLIDQHKRLVAEVDLCRKIINGAATAEQELAYMYGAKNPEPKP